MPETRQYLIPGGVYINEVTDAAEYLVPGGAYVNETTAAAAAGRIWRLAGQGGGLIGEPGRLVG